jgi:DNA-binding MarR family transcriptional regulator
MNNIIDCTENMFKAMMHLWMDTLKEDYPYKTPMRYQRFKVLRAVNGGVQFVPDIAAKAALDLKTTAYLLHKLMFSKFVTRSRIDFRSYAWKITPTGEEETARLMITLNKLSEQLRQIAKSNMENYFG